MNSNIRLQQTYLSTNTYKLPPNRSNQTVHMSVNYHRHLNNDNQTRSQFKSQEVQNDSGRNTRQKSVNSIEGKEYINGGGSVLLPISYKLECSNLTANQSQQETSHYRTTHNFYKLTELQNTESANEFFNEVASQISQQPKIQKVISQTLSQPPPPQQPINQPIYAKEQQPRGSIIDKSNSQKDCERCLQLQCQLQKVFKFMCEQLEIGAKQYSDKMSRIVTEQAREIIDLRKLLLNNQKEIIKISKLSTNSYQSNLNLSPSRSHLKSKSPSKISLTKSSSSTSANNPHRQKITMVSKQLSPNKSYNKTVQKVAASNSTTTIEQLSQKVRILQEKLQIGLKITNQTNQNIYVINKKIEMLEKGVINVLGAKVQRGRESLRVWMKQQEERQHNLYKQMKLISSRLNTFCSTQHQPLSPLLMNSQSTHSSPLIPHFQQCQSTELTNPKVLIRLKKYSSQIQDLRQLLTNLQTKQFKYDNYQINTLAEQIQQIRQKATHLQKAKHHISHKLVQTQHKLDQVMISASKYSKLTESISKHELSSQIVNNQQQTNQSARRVNMVRKNSIQLTYSHNNSNNNSYQQCQMGTKSMRVYEYPQSYYQGSKVTKCTKLTSGIYSHLESHSQSDYKGFLCGQASQYSQYMAESGPNANNPNHYRHQQQGNNNSQQQYNQQEQFEESFNSDSYDEQEQQCEQQDEFFYPVDLGSGERQEVNGFRVSASDRRMTGHTSVGGRSNTSDKYQVEQYQYPSTNVHRFMQVIECRREIPLKIEIDQTGYIKSAQNGMYIVDRNMDAFDLSKVQLEWLKQRGIIIIEH